MVFLFFSRYAIIEDMLILFSGVNKILQLFSKQNRVIARKGELLIRKLTGGDFGPMYAWFEDIDLMEYAFGLLAEEHHIARAARGFYHELMETPENAFAIVAGERLAGLVRFSVRDCPEKYVHLGIIIGERELLGRGLGTEAMKLVLGYFFRERKVTYATLDTAVFNERAQRCFMKCGFRKTGEFSEVDFLTGDVNHKIIMKLTRQDFLEKFGAGT